MVIERQLKYFSTRVAKSHIRIGTFEFAKTKNNETLKHWLITQSIGIIQNHKTDLEQVFLKKRKLPFQNR